MVLRTARARFRAGALNSSSTAGKLVVPESRLAMQRRGVLRGRLLVLAQLFEDDCGFDALGVSAGGRLLERVQQCVLKLLNEQVGVLEFVHELEELAGHLGLLDESFGIVEGFEDFVLLRNGRGAQDHRVGFLRGKIEMGIFLHQLAGVLPPFLPLIGGNDRARERGFDPVGSGGAIEAEKHETEQRDGVVGGEPLQAIEIGQLADFDVVVADGRRGSRRRRPAAWNGMGCGRS